MRSILLITLFFCLSTLLAENPPKHSSPDTAQTKISRPENGNPLPESIKLRNEIRSSIQSRSGDFTFSKSIAFKNCKAATRRFGDSEDALLLQAKVDGNKLSLRYAAEQSDEPAPGQAPETYSELARSLKPSHTQSPLESPSSTGSVYKTLTWTGVATEKHPSEQAAFIPVRFSRNSWDKSETLMSGTRSLDGDFGAFMMGPFVPADFDMRAERIARVFTLADSHGNLVKLRATYPKTGGAAFKVFYSCGNGFGLEPSDDCFTPATLMKKFPRATKSAVDAIDWAAKLKFEKE